jgi:hypothetical protein
MPAEKEKPRFRGLTKKERQHGFTLGKRTPCCRQKDDVFETPYAIGKKKKTPLARGLCFNS